MSSEETTASMNPKKTKAATKRPRRVQRKLDSVVVPKIGDVGTFLWLGKGPAISCLVTGIDSDILEIRYTHPVSGLVVHPAWIGATDFTAR